MAVTHVAYSDESHWNVGRYRSIGMISAGVETAHQLTADLGEAMGESGVKEFKWIKLKTAKYRFAAEKLLRACLHHAECGRLRVDVLIWDIEDRRHRVIGRDDRQNLGRMYYHLLRNVLTERWPVNAVWELYPEAQFAPDWQVIAECLGWKSGDFEPRSDLFTGQGFRCDWCQYFRIDRIVPVSSAEHPPVQLADFLAGLAAYSHQSYVCYEEWMRRCSGQSQLAFAAGASVELSNADRERCGIMSCLNAACKERNWQVSLASTRGFVSRDPAKPFNFWLYEPQHAADKAPTRHEL